MTIPVPGLPPPVIFTHNETLHAISLPPLASFLTSLTATDQLIKLNDILDRFRTPKSYHRVDIRVVESSELPLNSFVGWEEQDEKEGAEPVVLQPGMGLEEYMAKKAELAVDDGTEKEGREGKVAPKTSPNLQLSQPIGEELSRPQPKSHHHEEAEAIDVNTVKSTEIPVGASNVVETAVETFTPTIAPLHPIPPLTAVNPAPLSPTYHYPPRGPNRRVRELRLDLRTLDASALFALETWRRQVLGLEKIDMEWPDSIWYKEPSPTPPPPPLPLVKVAPPKKRGRPRKSAPPQPTKGEVENYDSLWDALHADGAIQIVGDGLEGNPELAEEAIINALGELARCESGVDLDMAATDATALSALDRVGVEVIQTTDRETGTGVAEAAPNAEAGPSTLLPLPPSTRSPTPDVVLEDAFNETSAYDPDFRPSPRRRTRSSMTNEEIKAPKKKRGGLARVDLSSPSKLDTPDSMLRLKRRSRPRPYEVQVLNSSAATTASPLPVRKRGRHSTSSMSNIHADTAERRKRRTTLIDSVELPVSRRRHRQSSIVKPLAESAQRVSAGSGENVRFASGVQQQAENESQSEDEWAFLKTF